MEGLGVANTVSWTLIYTGSALTYTSTALTSLSHYQYKVKSMSEASLLSIDSNIAEFIAAALPIAITLPVSPILSTTKTSIEITWDLPTTSATILPVNYYNIYWNEGVRALG